MDYCNVCRKKVDALKEGEYASLCSLCSSYYLQRTYTGNELVFVTGGSRVEFPADKGDCHILIKFVSKRGPEQSLGIRSADKPTEQREAQAGSFAKGRITVSEQALRDVQGNILDAREQIEYGYVVDADVYLMRSEQSLLRIFGSPFAKDEGELRGSGE